MILVERSAYVRAPIEKVWEVVERAEQLPAWLAGVRQAEVLSGEGYGRRQRVHAAGRGAAHEAEVIVFQPSTLIGWRERAKGAGARAEARTEVYVQLSEEPDGTSARLIVVRWPAGRVSGALLRLGMRKVGADLESSLARLTDLTAVGAVPGPVRGPVRGPVPGPDPDPDPADAGERTDADQGLSLLTH